MKNNFFDLPSEAQRALLVDAEHVLNIRPVALEKDIWRHKTAFFNASYANYENCLKGGFKLIPSENELKQLKTDFSKMHDAGMFYEQTLPFDEVVNVLSQLEAQINDIKNGG